LIRELGLTKCSDTVIGSTEKKTISGGERKRTSIGVEMITDPSIIMLDEPTSGLDSFRATGICKILQNLAHKKGKTIIATIHQPSSQAFKFFDRLILMADGNIVYQGLAANSAGYFNKIGYPSNKFSNPADIFMKVLAISYPKKETDL
jgi:ABC-type multidrug transport system ATPase subunit